VSRWAVVRSVALKVSISGMMIAYRPAVPADLGGEGCFDQLIIKQGKYPDIVAPHALVVNLQSVGFFAEIQVFHDGRAAVRKVIFARVNPYRAAIRLSEVVSDLAPCLVCRDLGIIHDIVSRGETSGSVTASVHDWFRGSDAP